MVLGTIEERSVSCPYTDLVPLKHLLQQRENVAPAAILAFINYIIHTWAEAYLTQTLL